MDFTKIGPRADSRAAVHRVRPSDGPAQMGICKLDATNVCSLQERDSDWPAWGRGGHKDEAPGDEAQLSHSAGTLQTRALIGQDFGGDPEVWCSGNGRTERGLDFIL